MQKFEHAYSMTVKWLKLQIFKVYQMYGNIKTVGKSLLFIFVHLLLVIVICYFYIVQSYDHKHFGILIKL